MISFFFSICRFFYATVFGVCLVVFFSGSTSAQTKPDSVITQWVPFSEQTYTTEDNLKQEQTVSQLRTIGNQRIYTIITPFIDSLKLPDNFLIHKSVSIYFDHQPVPENRFRINYHEGIVYLRYLFKDSLKHRLDVFYERLPLGIDPKYARRELRLEKQQSNRDTLKALLTKAPTQKIFDDIFSSSTLRKSGTIIRGITVGTNQDLTVNSGLRLQLDGSIAPGVEVTAALTDETTPIQPEGNTQTLQEFDRVFVEVRSKYAEVTIGDFNLSFQNTAFASLNRKLQGGKIRSMLDVGATNHEVQFGFASSRGKYHVNQFNGQDGNQGPYRLTDRDNEPFIIVLAGTEKVYVDGQQQTRGQDNDYIIDYGSGEITFMNRRLITAESKILVDFQYTDRLYRRNFLGFKVKNDFFNKALSIQTTFLNEADDQNSPIDLTLSDENIRTLKQAGSDPFKAIDTSAFVGVDINGKPAGVYVRIDSTVAGEPTFVYRYDPTAADAFWIPSFSYVGEGKGSYERLSLGIYNYVGPNMGSYDAFRFLPFPEKQQLVDIDLKLMPIKPLTLFVEGALSQNDLNTFSVLDDSTKDGDAYEFGFSLKPSPIGLFGFSLGNLSLEASQRLTTKNFAFFDRTQPVTFATNYNLIDYNGNILFDEKTSEKTQTFGLGYAPIKPLDFKYSFGRLARGGLFESNRHEGASSLKLDSLTATTANVFWVESRNDVLSENAKWFNSALNSRFFIYPFKNAQERFNFTPFVNASYSDKKTQHSTTDTLRSDSHRIIDIKPGLTLNHFFHQEITASFGYRHDELFYATDGLGARLLPASYARTLSLNWRVMPLSSFFAKFNLTRRVREFTERFRKLGNANTETLLFQLVTRASPFKGFTDIEWFYDVSTEKTSKTDRQFFAVQQGDGSYIWRDENQNTLKEFNEFFPITYSSELGEDSLQYVFRSFPSDELIPVVSLNTSIRLRLKPERLIGKGDGFTTKTLRALSSETVLRIEEKSTEKDLKQIYLLNFQKFQNDSTTLFGKIVYQQDLYLFENELTNVRFRYLESQSLSQFSLGIEKKLFLERGIRFMTRLGQKLGFELNMASTYNRSRALSSGSSNLSSTGREYEIIGYNVSPNVSYRPIQDWEIALLLSYDDRTDRQPLLLGEAKPVQANISMITLGSTYSFRGKGRLKAEIERTSTSIENQQTGSSTYELTQGNSKGETFIWLVNFQYRLSRFITASLNYDGRSLPKGQVIHTGKAEIRAVF